MSALSEIPLFPLKTVLFPGGPLPLRIFEARYVDMVKRCLREQQGFGVVLIREGEEAGAAEFHEIGTIARIVDFHAMPDGLLGLMTRGEQRFRVQSHSRQRDGLNVGQVTLYEIELPQPLAAEFRPLAELLEKLWPELGETYANVDQRFDDAHWVGFRLAEILPLTPPSRQFCLELEDPEERLKLLSGVVNPT
jgi:Lon protease-like protein